MKWNQNKSKQNHVEMKSKQDHLKIQSKQNKDENKLNQKQNKAKPSWCDVWCDEDGHQMKSNKKQTNQSWVEMLWVGRWNADKYPWNILINQLIKMLHKMRLKTHP